MPVRLAEPALHANQNLVDVNYHVFIRDKQSGAVDVAGDLPLSVAVREFASGIASRSHDLASVELGLRVVQVLETCA